MHTWVAEVRPVRLASGMLLVTTTAGPPLSGVAVNVYSGNVTPVGGSAVACAVVGPVSSALVRAGEPAWGVENSAVLEVGTGFPAMMASAFTLYGVLGCSPGMAQTALSQVAVTQLPPEVGQAVTW